MSRVILRGLNGTNPLGFLASLGLLRLLRQTNDVARLGFLSDGSFHPFVEGFDGDITALVCRDAALAEGKQEWWLEYEKAGKDGVIVADLKPPPPVFKDFLDACVEHWCSGDGEPVAFAAAFGTSVIVDRTKNKNIKPTAFHFTAAQQEFLDIVEKIRAVVTSEWANRSLFEGHADHPGSNLRWDPSAERNWALRLNDPQKDGTRVDAPLEWLAFRGLPLFPCFPFGARIITTAVSGRSDDMKMTWPLWSVPISLETARSTLQITWSGASRDRAMRGVFAVCTSAIRRTSQGFGNFGPAMVTS
ncbi:MAG: type I-G CRISPR-associated protein, Cas3-extension family [Gammaproteobacteria bacterium]